MASQLNRWFHLVSLLLLGPLTGNAATPMIAAGAQYALALRSDGTIAAWGRNDYGQLGNGQAAIRISPARVAGIDQVKAVAAGGGFTLALRADGSLMGWGSNSDGALGDGTNQSRSHPVPVTGIRGTIAAIAAGTNHSLAITVDGKVWAWGYGGYDRASAFGTDRRRIEPWRGPRD